MATRSSDGVEEAVCKLYGGTSCRNHRDMLPFVFNDFGRDGQLASPLFGVPLSDHSEAGRLTQEHHPPEVIQLLKEVEKKLGPGLRRSDYVRLTQGLKEIKRLSDLNEFASAVAVGEELKKIPGTFTPQQELSVQLQKLDEAGRKMMVRADDLWKAGRPSEALIEMDDVRCSFGKLACAGTAATRMATWEKAPEAKPFLAELKADRAARQLYQQGVEYDRKGDSKRALATLEKLQKFFPDSRFTARAQLADRRPQGRMKAWSPRGARSSDIGTMHARKLLKYKYLR